MLYPALAFEGHTVKLDLQRNHPARPLETINGSLLQARSKKAVQ